MKNLIRKWLYHAALGLASWPRPRNARHYRLIILKLDRLGDAVLSLGAVRRLIQEQEAEHTLLIVSPIAEPLFQSEFPSVQRLVLPAFSQRFFPDYLRFLFTFAPALRALSTDRLVCLRYAPSDYLHSIARLIQASQVFASLWHYPWEKTCLTFPSATYTPYPLESAATCLELEAHRRVLESVLVAPVSLAAVQPAITSIQPIAGSSLLLCPEAGDPLRQYPPLPLAAALRLFLENHALTVHLCIPPGSSPEPWLEAFRHEGLPPPLMRQPPAFTDLLHLVAQAGLILAPDSAPAHLATALDKPGVFLLGGGHFGSFAPWSKSTRQIWLHQPEPCYHCNWRCPHPEAFCLTGISPQTIARALADIALQLPDLRRT